MRARSRLLLLGAAMMQPGLLLACTVCHTQTGAAVRAGIFDGHFLSNALQLMAPFPIFLAIVVLICRGMPLRDLAPVSESRGVR